LLGGCGPGTLVLGLAGLVAGLPLPHLLLLRPPYPATAVLTKTNNKKKTKSKRMWASAFRQKKIQLQNTIRNK
jgi:hypothetical protein